MSKKTTPVFLLIAITALAVAVVVLFYALSVNAVQEVQVEPAPVTSTLQVKPNYGMQDAPNLVQNTASGTVLQNAPNTVQNTANGAELQNASICLQGC